MSDVMTFSKRTAAGLEEVLRTLLLDSENKVPADRLRIVGALSAGNIIESGSNSNGYYVKFADGTLIAFKGRTAFTLRSNAPEQPIAGVYIYFLEEITFPIVFAALPTVISNLEVNSFTYGWGGVLVATVNSVQLYYFTSTSAIAGQWATGSYLAIGRWKA